MQTPQDQLLQYVKETTARLEAEHAARSLFTLLQAAANRARREHVANWMGDGEVYQLAQRLTDEMLQQPLWADVAALEVARQAGQWAMLQEWNR